MVAAVLTLWSTSRFGAGLSPDSSGYFRLAADITADGPAFLAADKSVTQPPLYPLLLAVATNATGLPLAQAAAWCNGLSAAFLVAVLLAAARRCGARSGALWITGLVACGFGPFLAVWSMAWSEPLFLCMVAGCLQALHARADSMRWAALAGLLAGAAALVRYPGVVLVPVGVVWLLWPRADGLRQRMMRAACFAAIPTLFVGSYLARNVWVSGAALGPRPRSQSGALPNLTRMFEVLGEWFVPLGAPGLAVTTVLVVVVIVAAAWRGRLAAADAPALAGVRLHAAFCGAYAGFLVVSSSTVAFDPIDDRLMAPLAPSLLIGLAGVLGAGPWRSRAMNAAVATLAVMLAVACVAHGVHFVRANARHGAGGYSTEDWRSSPLLARLQSQSGLSDGVVVSNVPDALHLLVGVEARMAPARAKYNSADGTGIDAGNLFVVHPELADAVLVWREPNPRDYLFSPEQLQSMCALEEIARCADGAIYRVSRLAEGARAPK